VGFKRSRLINGFAVAAVLSMSGCASVPNLNGFDARVPLPDSVELTQVAFYSQTEDQCGPAALATVLEHAGVMRTLHNCRPMFMCLGAKVAFRWKCWVVLGAQAWCRMF